MKIAIHERKGSFSDQWINYCKSNNIEYKLVDAFDSALINNLADCAIFMWHHSHNISSDMLTAKRILFALEHAGIKVFPNFRTQWHFDDKVAQKYLLEAIGAPLVPSYVFYEKKIALRWARETTYPKVFKLKGGAGASNVKLVRNRKECDFLIKKAFGRGFSQFDRWNYIKDRWKKYKTGNDNIVGVIKGIGRLFVSTKFAKVFSKEKGYVYFQKFIPNNNFDVRIVVVGNKAAGEKRYVRKNDFRASGSGDFSYEGINIDIVRVAFDISFKLGLQSAAFDFVLDDVGQPLIVELSYGFGTHGISNAPGYWDENLKWYTEKFTPQKWIIQNMMENMERS